MKVFLSSTYVDLIEHRKAARDALAKLGLHVIGMESFGARAEDSTTACLAEVEECELFVGIYAHRYGYIPTGATVSITEQEFDHAQKHGKETFGFIVKKGHPWTPDDIEHDKKSNLNALLDKVKIRPVDFFTTPENLASGIAASVGRHLAEQQTVPGAPVYEPRKPSGNTLPNQSYFFGRAAELATIAEALSPESRTWGALIDGPGGIGKTALAIRAAHLAPADLFERKIFITAKVRDLTPDGEKSLTDFTRPDFLAMLNELARELGEDGIPHLPPEQRTNELRLALVGKRALIVFDNLETLPEDERARLFQFLNRLPAGNKAIVTSRRRSDTDARVVRLDRLAREEALQLLDELAANNPKLKRATPAERDELYAIAQGNPLLLRWIAGQLGREGSHCRTIAEACAFMAAAPAGNDPLEYIFGDLLETFTESETKVLAALTHFTLPAKAQWIAQMTGLPARAAETALEDLGDRSILTADLEARAFTLPPLAAQFIKTRRPEAVAKTGDALCDQAYALAMQYGGHDNYAGFKTLNAEWALLAAALPRLLQGDNERLQQVCEQFDPFLDFTGRWDECLWLAEAAEERALFAGDRDNAGWRAYQAGIAYYKRSSSVEVLACAARAATHWADAAPRQKAIVIHLRGLGHELQRDYPAAIAAYREVLEILRALSVESDDIAIALGDLAEAERENKDYSAAECDYREALQMAKKNTNKEMVAVLTGNLAELALDREQWAEAEALAREALELAEEVGRQELIASDCQRVALALLQQHRMLTVPSVVLAEAEILACRAVEIYTCLRSSRLSAAEQLLAQIEIASAQQE